MIREWGSSATHTWTPSVANAQYQLGVWEKNGSTAGDAWAAYAAIPAAILPPTVSLAASPGGPQGVGTPITATATTVGVTSPVYRFWLWNGTTWAMIRDWGNNTHTWTPDATGSYQLGVWATSSSVTEVQVLDSYQNKTYFHGQAGAIYKQHAQLVNVSRKPGEWQAYDIVFRAPRFDEDGKLIERARFTVFHNGVLIQNNVVVMGVTSHDRPPYYEKHDANLPIGLQILGRHFDEESVIHAAFAYEQATEWHKKKPNLQ